MDEQLEIAKQTIEAIEKFEAINSEIIKLIGIDGWNAIKYVVKNSEGK